MVSTAAVPSRVVMEETRRLCARMGSGASAVEMRLKRGAKLKRTPPALLVRTLLNYPSANLIELAGSKYEQRKCARCLHSGTTEL
jgi:hypothetical protein